MTQTNLFPGDEDFDRMKAKTLSAIKVRSRARTIRHRIIAVLSFACVAAVGTAAAVLIASAPVGVLNSTAHCFSEASMDQLHSSVPPMTVYYEYDQDASKLLPLEDRTSQAEVLCALGWSTGTLVDGKDFDRTKTYEVPNLVICQEPDQNLAVFPSDKTAREVCRELGLITPRY